MFDEGGLLDNLPDIAEAMWDYPAEVRDSLSCDSELQVTVEEADTPRFKLPSKDSGISWAIIKFRVTMDLDTGLTSDMLLGWDGADGDERVKLIDKGKCFHIRSFFIWKATAIEPEDFSLHDLPTGQDPNGGSQCC